MKSELPRTIAFLATLLTVACGDKTEQAGKDSGAAKAVPVKQTMEEALAGLSKPGLFGPYGAIRIGMSKEELTKVSPVFADKGDFLSKKDFGIGYSAYIDDGKLAAMSVLLGDEELAAVEKAWGGAVEFESHGSPAKAWFNPEERLRAIAHPEEGKLVIEPYLPHAAIIGEPGKPLGVETSIAFLGATIEELKSGYPDNFTQGLDNLAFMEWPPDEYGGVVFKVELGLAEGKVTSFKFWLHHGKNTAAKRQALDLLVAKYGAAVEGKSITGRPPLKLGDASVTVTEVDASWLVEIEPAAS